MNQPIKKSIKDNVNIVNDNIITLLIDGNNLAKICTSADKRVNSDGIIIGGVFQFILQVKLALKLKNFDRICIMWDGEDGGIMRFKFLPEYKANRDKDFTKNISDYDKYLNNYSKRILEYSKSKRKTKPKTENEKEDFNRQVKIIKECFEELFVRQCCVDNVEGDDLIAYYCLNKRENEKIIIVSADRDLTQLISNDIAIYLPSEKKYISVKNYLDVLGYHYKNVLVKKIICGDVSDNIKGIKGVGDETLFKLVPDLRHREVTIEEIIEKAKNINEERVNSKKKPLKNYYNIINRITDGSQGHNIYEINHKIINLKEPLITEEGIEEMNDLINLPIDPNGRNWSNLYEIILKNNITDLIDDNNNKFVNFFECFKPIIDKEVNEYKKSNFM